MSVPQNPNLSASYVKPTVAVSIDTNAASGADAQEASTVLLWTEQLSGGTATLNTVSDLNSVTDAINAYGTKSSAVRQMRHALAQSGVPGAVTFKGIGVSEPSAGTSGIGQIVCSIPGGSNPSASGGATITMGGSESAAISWTTSDTATTIGDSLVTALNALLYEPWGTWSNSSGTVTATANAKGAFIEDHSVRVVYSNQGGVYFGPGSLTVTTAPGHSGTISIACGTQTSVTAVVGNEATAYAVAQLVQAQVNSGDFALQAGTASNAAPSVLPLYFAPGKDCRRVSATIATVTTTTLTLTGGSATDGDGAADAGSITYANTPGAGYPTLTTAIANVRAAGSFGEWVGPWFDSATAGAQFSAISTDGNGAPNQNRGQKLMLGTTGTESAAKALTAATSPAMNANQTNNNNGMRGGVVVFPDAAQPGYVLAAKVASLRAASDPFTNYDNVALTDTSTARLPVPSPYAIANWSDANQNQAIKDGLTPLAVVGGSLVIIFGRTTLSTTDSDLWDWSWIDQADDHRADFRAQASATFAGCSLIPQGSMPASRKDVDPQALAAFAKAQLRRWQAQGTYVGATVLADQCAAQINSSNHGRADVVYPESPKIPLHQIGAVALRTSIPTG